MEKKALKVAQNYIEENKEAFLPWKRPSNEKIELPKDIASLFPKDIEVSKIGLTSDSEKFSVIVPRSVFLSKDALKKIVNNFRFTDLVGKENGMEFTFEA